MKQIMQTLGIAAGSILIGFFANRLDTVGGNVCFVAGVILLAVSIGFVFWKS